MHKTWFIALLSLLFTFPSTVVAQQTEKTYPLIWRFRKGLNNIMQQRVEIDKVRKQLSGEQKTFREKIRLDMQIHWKIQNVIDDNKALVTSILKKGKIKIVKDGKTHILDVEKSIDSEEAKSPLFAPYVPMVHGGIAFLLDIKQQKVLVTWELKDLGNGKYEREMVRGNPDPRGMEYAYKQLINQEVPLEHTWELVRPRGPYTYNYLYKFSQLTPFKGNSVAKIDVNGEIKKGEQKLGNIVGFFYHDHKRNLMMYYKVKEEIEETWQRGEEQYQDQTTVNVQWQLIRTNAD